MCGVFPIKKLVPDLFTWPTIQAWCFRFITLSKIRILSIERSSVKLETDVGFRQSWFSFSGTMCMCVSFLKIVCLYFLYEEMNFFGGNKEYVNFFIIKPT